MNDNIVSILKDMPVTSWHFFDSSGEEIGKLEWSNGTISFIGNADESAKRFFIFYLKDIVAQEHILQPCTFFSQNLKRNFCQYILVR